MDATTDTQSKPTNFLIYGTHFTVNEKGACKEAGVAFRIRFKGFDGKEIQKDYEEISTEKTYGDLWLSNLLKMITLAEDVVKPDKDGNVDRPIEFIKLFTSQFEAGKMAGKIERILCDATSRKATSLADIEHLVLKDARYTPKPNNHLYAQIVFKLIHLQRAGTRFVQLHHPCGHTMDLVKSLHKQIAPHKVLIDKTKSKSKSKPKKAVPLL